MTTPVPHLVPSPVLSVGDSNKAPLGHSCQAPKSHGLCVTGRQPTIYLVNGGRVAGPGFAQVEYDIPGPEPASVLLLGFQFVSVALFALCAARFGRNNDIAAQSHRAVACCE